MIPLERAPYAARPDLSLGRLLAEPASPTRSDFQRDRDRIIHSTAFRRLAHKTQVFVPHEGDHYRTRLTHSIEVGQLARALARSLRLDEDLAEAIALAHDLGHTPFGHTGEDVLDNLMKDHGGFDHNAQTLRVVTKLERRYAAFDGLNLTYETLEGLAKHNGPLIDQDGTPRSGHQAISAILADLDRHGPVGLEPIGLGSFPTAEAQCAALADDIAYNAHDLDDGLRAGLFTLEACREVRLLADGIDEILTRYPRLEETRTVYELTRRIITHFVEDATHEATNRLHMARSLTDIRQASQPMVAFSTSAGRDETAIKTFLWGHMYRHPDIVRIRERAAGVVADLFEAYRQDPTQMSAGPPSTSAGQPERAVCDYIAGMTDRFALAEHRRLFVATPELRYRARS